jgi:hypothetical protein
VSSIVVRGTAGLWLPVYISLLHHFMHASVEPQTAVAQHTCATMLPSNLSQQMKTTAGSNRASSQHQNNKSSSAADESN